MDEAAVFTEQTYQINIERIGTSSINIPSTGWEKYPLRLLQSVKNRTECVENVCVIENGKGCHIQRN
ncbi:hypothetical protein GJ496_008618 [Pomphorhynchus laevis]|nr:hypothetical protein GJ496_008618 [Pomphorhynchus laevis]